uniref:Centromere protein N n=1 Tax=Saimiri boliviensis boliviensis TaxID=39432 RepID=A0A2K6V4J2_SAIBB
MDETVAEFIKRTILQIPMNELTTILKAWDFLSENQLERNLVQHLVRLCEKKRAGLNDATLLDIIYTQFHQHQKVWNVFQMSKGPGEDVDLFDMKQFKNSFKKIIQRALKNATVSFRETEENVACIRIAWGNTKPTYVVHYSQTPYAFTSSSKMRRNMPLLGQALTIASKHHQIAIVFKQYNQTFETHNSMTPLQERSLGLDTNMDSRIIHENIETFGDYPQPQLEFAQYKLETKFKGRIPPMPNKVLSRLHLLEALKSLAPAGIADAPVSPLLTCIPKKRMNYFKIRDK